MTAISSVSLPFRRVITLVVMVIFIGVLIILRDLSSSTLYNGSEPPNHRKAAQLSAKVLLESPVAKNYQFVPKLIHQSWSTQELPSKFETWSRSCREQNPDWQWVLWTDDDNLDLVKKHFPWFLEYYQKLPGEIYRADLVRNMYMYIYGGLYADLDIECLRPANELFETYNITAVPYKSTYDGSHHRSSNRQQERKAFFGRMGTNDTFEHSIPNA
ncbi:nucleotide-diphospho-sugar transferase [Lipomyces chichibuensis]|uniref:nucleotide-diphospho-sugar transferase n=1 Tax=Lipomyces chichibuensis TaxID=1546026 RepID=UPI0033442488